MSLPVLYTFRRCPYAIRARLALFYSEQDVEIREVLLRNKPESMVNLSRKATVPVLILADGTVIDESREIINWALDQHDPYNLLPNKETIHFTKQLVDDNDGDFKFYLDRYKYSDRYPENKPAFYRQNAERFISRLEECLSAKPFLSGNALSLSDICILPFVRQFAMVDKNWFDNSRYVKVQTWLNTFLSSSAFNFVMKKYAPWKNGDTAVTFL